MSNFFGRPGFQDPRMPGGLEGIIRVVSEGIRIYQRGAEGIGIYRKRAELRD